MPEKRTAESLTLADLPGADPVRFDEWKRLHRRARIAPLVSPLIYASAFVTVPVIGGGIGWLLPIVFWFIYMFAYVGPLARAERGLAADLGVPAVLGLPSPGGSTRPARATRVIKIILIIWLIGIVLSLIVLAVQLSSSKNEPRQDVGGAAVVAAPAGPAAEPFIVHLKDVAGQFQGARVAPQFFDEALTKPHAGRFFLPEEHESAAAPVVVISHNAWQNVFASDPSVLGRAIEINGQLATIVGIGPPAFLAPGATDFWTPAQGARQVAP